MEILRPSWAKVEQLFLASCFSCLWIFFASHSPFAFRIACCLAWLSIYRLYLYFPQATLHPPPSFPIPLQPPYHFIYTLALTCPWNNECHFGLDPRHCPRPSVRCDSECPAQDNAESATLFDRLLANFHWIFKNLLHWFIWKVSWAAN